MFPQSHWAVCYRWEVVHHIRLNVTHRNGMGVPEMQPPSEQAPHRLPRASNCQILRNESSQHSPASLISDKPSSCLSPGRAALPHSNARDVWMHQATNQTLHILWKTGALRTPLQPIPNASIFKTGSEKQPYIIRGFCIKNPMGRNTPKTALRCRLEDSCSLILAGSGTFCPVCKQSQDLTCWGNILSHYFLPQIQYFVWFPSCIFICRAKRPKFLSQFPHLHSQGTANSQVLKGSLVTSPSEALQEELSQPLSLSYLNPAWTGF